MHRRTDPRSPVQNVRDRSLLPFGLVILAIAGIGVWQDRDRLVDWYDDDVPDPLHGSRGARANLALLFSTDDYPIEAIRNEEQGTTAFRLVISRRGHVSDCIVTSSSGSDVLDRATCDIVQDRARYEPARDAVGRRISGQDTGRIRWELPED